MNGDLGDQPKSLLLCRKLVIRKEVVNYPPSKASGISGFTILNRNKDSSTTDGSFIA